MGRCKHKLSDIADSSIKLYFPYTTRWKLEKCLPEIKKEISRKGGPKSTEKVLQISQEKIQNQVANEKALPPKLSEEGLRYNLGCMARLPSSRERGHNHI